MSSKKILIIDDEPDVVAYLKVILESNGYEFYSADNIKTAEKLVKEIQPGLICLDIVMPKETGISFYIKIRRDKNLKNIPVMMISGIVEKEKFNFYSYVKDVSVPPPECYMEKPINVEKYLQRIQELIH
jgi:CheY-like chemotaxis protein